MNQQPELWDCLVVCQQISYQSIESSDPGINVPGPRRTVSKLKNETYHMFSNLHPGTTYLISVRARTAKGFGQTALTEITTNISGIITADWLAWRGIHAFARVCESYLEKIVK